MAKTSITIGVAMNWTAMVTTAVITFFLAPFIVHQLGNTTYGVWVLVTSSIAYMGTLDLGLRGAVLHFVAKHYSDGDHEASMQAVSAALWCRLVISSIVAAVTVLLTVLIDRAFRLPPEMQSQARIAVLATGLGFIVTLTCGVFGGVVAALQRFDLLAAVTIGQTVAVAVSAICVLKAGYGIVGLALSQLAITVLAGWAHVALCFYVYPGFRFRLEWPSVEILRKLWTYSFYMFVISISGQVIYYTDNLVVGAFVSAGAVTFFAIAGRLIDFHRQPAAILGQTLMPVASGLNADFHKAELQRLLFNGTRVAVLIAWPIEIVLFIRAETFIGLWMGPPYAPAAAAVLRILLLSNFFIAANNISANITFGLGKHKPFALWQTAEAAANLVLSMILVRKMGITGVAWGTTIPSLVTHAVLWPPFICRLLDVPLKVYFWRVWLRPAMALAPFTIGCLWLERTFRPEHLSTFFLGTAALLPLIVVGLGLFFYNDIRGQLTDRSSIFHRSVLRFNHKFKTAVFS